MSVVLINCLCVGRKM